MEIEMIKVMSMYRKVNEIMHVCVSPVNRAHDDRCKKGERFLLN